MLKIAPVTLNKLSSNYSQAIFPSLPECRSVPVWYWYVYVILYTYGSSTLSVQNQGVGGATGISQVIS
jgi:hypothetical protein